MFMARDDQGSWLFLLFNLPAKHSSDRVKVWRRLKKFGAIQLKTSTYVLPDEPLHYKRFQEIYDIDFFESSHGEDLERLFRTAESLESDRGESERKVRLRARGISW